MAPARRSLPAPARAAFPCRASASGPSAASRSSSCSSPVLARGARALRLLRWVGIRERGLVVAFPRERLVAGGLEVAREADHHVALRRIRDPPRHVERV